MGSFFASRQGQPSRLPHPKRWLYNKRFTPLAVRALLAIQVPSTEAPMVAHGLCGARPGGTAASCPGGVALAGAKSNLQCAHVGPHACRLKGRSYVSIAG